MTILSYFGWNAYPIARLGNDNAARLLVQDMERWGVKGDYLNQSEDGRTPLIIERISRTNGITRTRFEWICPICSKRFPKRKQLCEEEIDRIIINAPVPRVFYMDRVSASTVKLARYYKSRGAIIFFEPSLIGNQDLFQEMLRITDIVKYSKERLVATGQSLESGLCPIEIETLGHHGLRYRTQSRRNVKLEWVERNSFVVTNPIDPVGAGDWCSAAIINQLFRNEKGHIEDLSRNQIDDAILCGQAFASLSCNEEGARGIMYSQKKGPLITSLYRLIGGEQARSWPKRRWMQEKSLLHFRLNSDFCNEFHPQSNQKHIS